MWDQKTGTPVHNAIVWQDTRTDRICDELARDGGQDRFRKQVGLPLATYFSGPKIRWIIDNVPGVTRAGAERGHRVRQHRHVGRLEPDRRPERRRPRHRSDERVAHDADGPEDARLGRRDPRHDGRAAGDAARDQVLQHGVRQGHGRRSTASRSQASWATSRRRCSARRASRVGEAKNTYGTGNFLLLNTGTEAVQSENGLLTTVGYKIGDQDAVYCLEGAIAVTGSLVQWLRDNLGIIANAPRDREPGQDRRRQRRRLLRAGLLGPVRAVLEERRTRGDRRPHPLREQGPPGAGRARGDGVPDQGGRGRHERRLRRAADIAQGRRRHGAERPADAVPGRHPGRAGDPADGRRDHRRSARRTPPVSRSGSGARSRTCAPTGARTTSGRRRWTAPAATTSTTCGRRP